MIAPIKLVPYGPCCRGVGKQHVMVYDPEPTPDQIKQMFHRSELLSGSGCTEWEANMLGASFSFELRRLSWFGTLPGSYELTVGTWVWGLLNEEGDFVSLFPGIVTPDFVEHHLFSSPLGEAYNQ